MKLSPNVRAGGAESYAAAAFRHRVGASALTTRAWATYRWCHRANLSTCLPMPLFTSASCGNWRLQSLFTPGFEKVRRAWHPRLVVLVVRLCLTSSPKSTPDYFMRRVFCGLCRPRPALKCALGMHVMSRAATALHSLCQRQWQVAASVATGCARLRPEPVDSAVQRPFHLDVSEPTKRRGQPRGRIWTRCQRTGRRQRTGGWRSAR
jgi:hypothetical protein